MQFQNQCFIPVKSIVNEKGTFKARQRPKSASNTIKRRHQPQTRYDSSVGNITIDKRFVRSPYLQVRDIDIEGIEREKRRIEKFVECGFC